MACSVEFGEGFGGSASSAEDDSQQLDAETLGDASSGDASATILGTGENDDSDDNGDNDSDAGSGSTESSSEDDSEEEGSEDGESADEGPSTDLDPLLINFDNWGEAPEEFRQIAGPLRDEYRHLGVFFAGIRPDDGAGVISAASWPAPGGSGPNYLALNCDAKYKTGGRPCGSLTIVFDPPAVRVEFVTATNYEGLQLEAVASNRDKEIVGRAQCPAFKDFRLCKIEAADIHEMSIGMSENKWYAIDNLLVTF